MNQTLLQWLLSVSLFITFSNGGSITCSEVGECQNEIVNCPNDDATCNIVCSAAGCLGTTINCLDGHFCQVQTGGDNSARLAKINGNAATQLYVFTGASGQKQLEEANITCPNSAGAHCNVHCDGGGYQNCREMHVDASLSATLWLSCDDTNEACVNVDVWCPRNNVADSCTLDGQISTGSVTGMQIYSQHGFRTMLVYDGLLTASIGWMYCLDDYSASCQIDADPASASSQMACITSGSQICDNPDTNNPTVSPITSQPTTATATPTTAIPTTAMPTTSTPTTAMPTTSEPTTVSPTTSVPTSNPTTNTPTTMEPTMHTTVTNYTVSFEIDEEVTEADINDIIEQSLTAYTDIAIVSTSINGESVVIELRITDNGDIDADIIESKIEDGLQDKYDKTIDVEVTENDLLYPESNNDVLIVYILVVSVLLICCCTLICCIGRKFKLDVNQIEMLNHDSAPRTPQNDYNINTKGNGKAKISVNVVDGTEADENKEDDDESSCEDLYGNVEKKTSDEQTDRKSETSGDKMEHVEALNIDQIVSSAGDV